MKNQKKRGEENPTPQNSISSTGESFRINQRYKKQFIRDQFRETENAFFKGFFTMKTIAVQLNIDRANICRYVATLRKSNRIQLVKKGVCPITKSSSVGFYTTNPEYFVSTNQLNLF